MNLPLEYIPIINVVVIISILLALFFGYKRGIIWQAVKVIGLLAVILLGFIFAPGLAKSIHLYPVSWTPFKDTVLADLFYEKLNTIAIMVVFVLLGLLILIIVKPLFKAITEVPIIKQINSILGAILALVPAYIVLLVFTFVLNTALISNGKEVIEQSVFKYIDKSGKAIISFVDSSFTQNQALQKMLNDPKSLIDTDLKSIISWMENNKVTSEDIKTFLSGYGINLEKIDELLTGEGK